MNCYEHTVIIRQDTSIKQQQDLIDKIENIIVKNLGKIIKIEKWGFLNLANAINKNKKGFYVHYKFEGDGKIIKELENAERIDNLLLRYLTVKVKKFDLETNYFDMKDKKNKLTT